MEQALIEKTNDAHALFKRKGLILQMILALKQICNHPATFLKGAKAAQQNAEESTPAGDAQAETAQVDTTQASSTPAEKMQAEKMQAEKAPELSSGKLQT